MINSQKIILGGGCFWCLEAVFQRVIGVKKVISGYSGGHVENPTYREVCTGNTGHIEVVEIEFDTEVVSLELLLEIFWEIHDPTSIDKQGGDEGSQYRSAIFYTNDRQKEIVEKSKMEIAKKLKSTVVTQIQILERFYPAEKYHQNYYNQHKEQGYCRIVISPKLKKLQATGRQNLIANPYCK